MTWTGVAGLVFEADGTRIAFDPFVSRPGVFSTLFRRARPDDAAVASAFPRLDAAFAGHAHYDHAMDLPAVARASPAAAIHGGATTVALLERLGVERARLREVRHGGAVVVGPFRVTPVASAHGVVPVVGWFDRVSLGARGTPGTPFRWPRGEVFAYRVEVGGRSLHLQGSAGIDDAALSEQPPADVLVACLAARKGTPRYLSRLVERLRPKVLVPCHHDDFFAPLSAPPKAIPTLRWDSFLAELDAIPAPSRPALWLPVRGVAASL
jgi:L-ascorbate metabolism protein UlaG (beta-lactamase superfamily)